MPDLTVWTGTKSGHYSVKICYKTIQEQALHEVAEPHPFWSDIWSLKVLPRVVTFLWRAGKGALPVQSELHKRLKQISPMFQLCKIESETVHHMLFLCPHVKATWWASPLQICMPELPLDTTEACMHLLQNLDEQQQKLISYLAWNIWKARNGFIFENRPPMPLDTVSSSINMCQLPQTPHLTAEPHRQEQPEPRNNLHTLTEGVAFGMSDASIDTSGNVGIAVAYFYDNGALQFLHFVPVAAETIFQAEADAMEVALCNWTALFFQQPKRLFTDSKQLADFFCKKVRPTSCPAGEALGRLSPA
jgi:zinc-binding in reverse transcriptase